MARLAAPRARLSAGPDSPGASAARERPTRPGRGALGPRLQIAACALLFSTGGAAVKWISVDVWGVAGLRSGIAALALVLFLPAARRAWSRPVLLVGAAYAATYILFVAANKLTTAANTIFLQATAPLYVSFLGAWWLKEPLHRRDAGALGAIVIGLALCLAGTNAPLASAPNPGLGNGLAVLTGLTFALGIVGLRGLSARGDGGEALAVVVAANAMAFLFSLPWAWPIRASAGDAVALLYLGVIQIGLAYALLARGIRHVTALEASLLLLIEPALNPVWAWLVQGERPGGASILGGVFILGATVWKTLDGARPPR